MPKETPYETIHQRSTRNQPRAVDVDNGTGLGPDRQRKALEAICAYLRRHGLPPLRGELFEVLGLTHPSSVDVYLTALQAKA